MRKESIEDERGLVGEVLEVLLHITVEDREEARWLCSKGTQWATCSVPIESDALCPFVSDQWTRGQLQAKALQT